MAPGSMTPPHSSKVHLAGLYETELLTLLSARAQHGRYPLTGDPAAADLILLLGNFALEPHLLLNHPLYRAHPDKCVVYTEEDIYLPLLPGAYCSARVDDNHRCGRTFAFGYVSANGAWCSNRHITAEPARKEYLFSFQGGSTSLVRKRLFKIRFNRPDVLIENTSDYRHWEFDQMEARDALQQRYARTVAASHFVLCPRGAGSGSIRLFEVMRAGVAPVLLADDYPLPPQVPWDDFLLRFREKDIARLPELLGPQLASSAERGRLAREAWRRHFAPETEFDGLVAGCLNALHHGPPGETVFRRRQAGLIVRAERRRKLRALVRNAVVGGMRLLKVKSPYQLNR